LNVFESVPEARVQDQGLFGPISVTWRLHADPAMAFAGLRAILLQAVHPLAMAGVAHHSTFRTDPWGRLQRTGMYVGVVTFGTTAEVRRAAARVRGLHRKLSGVEPETGAPYRVGDPHLLLWVHCCEVDSVLAAMRAAGVPLTPTDADQYVAEQVRAAELVGLDARTVPGSVAELAAYFDGIRPELRVTAEARRALHFVLFPPMPPVAWPAKPVWAGLATVAVGLLPRWARQLYGLPTLPSTGVAAAAAARAFRATTVRLPAALREGPMLKAARARLAAEGLHWTGYGVVPLQRRPDELAG
jgi:uncharacterized protein (DUF2236 family)